MLSNTLATSSLPKREVWNVLNLPRILRRKCLHGTTRKFREIQSLPFSSLFAKSCGSKRESVIASHKILRTEVHKVWRKWGFFYAIWPILLQQMQSKTR